MAASTSSTRLSNIYEPLRIELLRKIRPAFQRLPEKAFAAARNLRHWVADAIRRGARFQSSAAVSAFEDGETLERLHVEVEVGNFGEGTFEHRAAARLKGHGKRQRGMREAWLLQERVNTDVMF